MANRYHSFYLEDLVTRMIPEAVEEKTMKPLRMLMNNRENSGIATAMYNDRIAWFNEGLRELAETLVKALYETAEEEEREEAEVLKELEERKKREAESSDEH